MAKLNKEEFLKQHGAFYCSEGQFTVANLGPQEFSLVKKRAFGNTALGKLIDTYNAAPGYKDMSCRAAPPQPHDRLEPSEELGAEKGGISEDQFEHLEETQAHRHLSRIIPRTCAAGRPTARARRRA